MAELVVRDLKLRLGDNDILKGVSLVVRRGEVVALLGPSGSGKTTLLRAVAGLEQPHAGSVAIGETVFFDAARKIDVPAEKRGLGLVFQSYALWPHRSVFDNVAYGLKLRKVADNEIRQRVEKALAQIGLAHLAERFPHQLSGGQQQRVAIARALVYEPPVILLDEPLSNLDAKLRDEARAWLRALIRQLGLSALCVTHDQLEAMALADQVLLLNLGAIEQAGPPSELYGNPVSLFAAEFMGVNNRVEGRLEAVQDGRARLAAADAVLEGVARGRTMAPGQPATGVIRIERLRLVDGPGANRVPMQVETAMYLGERYELLLRRGDWTLRAFAAEAPGAGELLVELPAEHLWVF